MRPFLIFCVALGLAACDTTTETASADVVYVGNQGNFSDNNGSVTRYEPETGAVTQDAVPNLGGLVQNLYGGGNTLRVLLNFDDSYTTGRGRIVEFDVVNRRRTGEVDVRTPRAYGLGPTVTSVGPTTAFVSNLYDDTVTPVDFVTGHAGTPIPVGGAPEGVVSASGRTYVANGGYGYGTTLSVLDTADGTVLGTVEDVCDGPRTLLVDREQEVWVICTGASDFNTGEVTAPGQVVVLDGATGTVRQRYVAGGTLGSATLGVDGVVTIDSADNRDEVYVIAPGGLLRFDATTNTLVGPIDVPGAPIGAVAYDTRAGQLYLGRPNAQNPYGADGTVTIHDRSGTQVGQFTAGIAPSAIVFAVETPAIEG